MGHTMFACLVVWLGMQAFTSFGHGLSERQLLTGESKFNYQAAGADWPETFPDCGGDQQSPINIISSDAFTSFRDLTARLISFGQGTNFKVQNTGQSVHVTWEEVVPPSILLPVVDGQVSASIDPLDPRHENSIEVGANGTVRGFEFAEVQLKQFHFHISSENAIDGVLFPMEQHIVANIPKEEVEACGDDGCTVVIAILYQIGEEDNDFLEQFFEAAPEVAGEEFEDELPEDLVLNFNDMIPEKKSYYSWLGSFTTPPCTEGVTWILFDTMNTVSARQLTLLQSKMGAVRTTCQTQAEEDGDLEIFKECNNIGDLKNNRALQPLNGRRVSHSVTSPSASR